jgi:hypothetical protein
VVTAARTLSRRANRAGEKQSWARRPAHELCHWQLGARDYVSHTPPADETEQPPHLSLVDEILMHLVPELIAGRVCSRPSVRRRTVTS